MEDVPSDHDNALLTRLNALKKSNVSFSPNNFLTTLPVYTNPANDLTARFQKLSGTLSSNLSNGSINDFAFAETDVSPPSPTIEELLAELGPEDQYTLNASEVDEAQKLLAEAKLAVPADDRVHHDMNGDNGPSPLTPQALEEHNTSEEEEDKNEEAEAEDFLKQILDEVELEKRQRGEQQDNPSSPSSPKPTDPPPHDTTSNPTASALAFPSLPTHDLPPPLLTSPSSSPPRPLFPSAPTSAPSAEKARSKQKKPPTFSDAEIDSWCIICCDDAKVRCQGCAGGLYCWGCWKEGHSGPEVGFEERRHRWVGLEKGEGKGDGR